MPNGSPRVAPFRCACGALVTTERCGICGRAEVDKNDFAENAEILYDPELDPSNADE